MSHRKIASNLLWTPQGLYRNPLVEVASEGLIVAVTTCAAPDRLAGTEFYAGMLVSGDVVPYFEALRPFSDIPLPELLAHCCHSRTDGNRTPLCVLPAQAGISTGRRCGLAVISGLDYDRLLLTPASRIRRIV